MSRIVSIGTATPKYKYLQSDIADFMVQSLPLTDKQEIRKLKILYKKTAINYRYSVLPDFNFNGHISVLFGLNGESSPTVQNRLKIFEEEAYNLSALAIDDCIERTNNNSKKEFDTRQITHLITVSCTGMSAPGLEIKIVKSYGLNENISRFAINFMGCYAAFHALKIAHAICKSDSNATVLIVSVELCTIHFQKEITEDNLLANALFADGSAALLVTGKNSTNNYFKRLIPDVFDTQIIEEGSGDMAWNISSHGFLMTLSSHIPDLINGTIKGLVDRTLDKLSGNEHLHYAIHPGGKKIIDKCIEILSLNQDELASSLFVLENYGNMSAPTVLFVLKKLWDEKINWDGSENIFTAGFGPGLTMETAILKTEHI
jgi:alpha-pyrone synthase